VTTIRNTASILGAEHHRYSFDCYVLDIERGALLKDDADVLLRPKCFAVLTYLVKHHGVLLSKDELMTAIWPNQDVTEDSLTQCLIQIRKALGDSKKRMLRTIPRRGFIFDVPVTIHQPGEQLAPAGKYQSLLSNRRPSRWSAAAAVVLCLAIAISWWNPYSGSQVQSSVEIPVLPHPVKAGDNYDPIAYGHYLKGKFFYDRRGDGDNERAIEQYQQAIDLDPRLVGAWVGMAGSINSQGWNNVIPWEEALGKVKILLDQAYALDPENAEVLIRLSVYFDIVDLENESQQYLERAMQLGQDNALVLSIAAGQASRNNQFEQAITLQRRAVKLDPLGYVNQNNLAHYLFDGGHYDEARSEWFDAVALSPESSSDLNWLIGLTWVMQKKFAAADMQMQQVPFGAERDQGMALVHLGNDDQAQFIVAVERLSSGTDFNSAFYLAQIYSFKGDLDQSFRWLAVATDRVQQADSRKMKLDQLRKLHTCPMLAPMRADPRWSKVVAITNKKAAQSRS
jgi:DNA-binding winged helix-turn-helix (wHTH) protein/Flp pilus assembly protein TadD